MDIHSKALDSIFGDLDDMESKKMFGEPDGDEGTSITITITPGGASVDSGESNGIKSPEEEMNKGGMAYSQGGIVSDKDMIDMQNMRPTDDQKTEMAKAQSNGVLSPQAQRDSQNKNYSQSEINEGTENDKSLPPYLRGKKKK